MNKELVDANTIYSVISGSHAYGLNRPDSDEDVRGICVPPREYFLCSFKNFEQYENNVDDVVVYGINKFFKLASECNPNIIELFYVPDSCIKLTTEWSKLILDNKHLFISKAARHRFSGYASAQIKRVKRHKRWLDNPPTKQPLQKDYVWDRKIDGEEIKVYDENAYKTDLEKYNNYLRWRRDRNPKRAQYEKDFGYDVKHVQSLYRLMEEGKELLLEGKITFPCKNADFLRSIKEGALKYDDVLKYAEDMDIKMKEYADQSDLPERANLKKIDKLQMSILESYWDAKDKG